MDKDTFLNLIRQLESSGGKNLKHKKLKSGMHKDQAAIGEYAIMPNTANEFIRRRELKGQFGPDEALMRQMTPEELQEFLKDQDRVEQGFGSDIADRVLQKSKGDIDKAAYMWNEGHNLKAADITKEDLDSHDYVRKFRNLKKSLNKRNIASEE